LGEAAAVSSTKWTTDPDLKEVAESDAHDLGPKWDIADARSCGSLSDVTV
jgi:hypothetical protein